jgi:NAD+ synthase
MHLAHLPPAPLDIDCHAEVERIAGWMREAVARRLHRRGVVLGLSGGVDSSVCAALAVRALGAGKVFGLLMPEQDSASSSEANGARVAQQLGVSFERVHIGSSLEAIGCYRWRDEAIRAIFPDYGPTWRSKIAIAGGAAGKLNFFRLVVEAPDGKISEQRLPLREYLQIVAATNYKQRFRKAVEYFHADRLNYAVIGTPNRLEYDQGFFVKNGDGSADLKPIAHLYKTQVYALARHLGLPEEVRNAMPTTDTYSMQQSQDEFYFSMPYQRMDIALWAHNHNVPAAELARFLEIEVAQAEHVYRDIDNKRRTTAYLHAAPMLVEPVRDISA